MVKRTIITLTLALTLLAGGINTAANARNDEGFSIYREQIDFYSSQIQKSPQDYQNYLKRADLYLETNQLVSARADLQKALELAQDPDLKEYLQNVILYTELQGTEALPRLDKLITKEPGNPRYSYLKGLIYLQSGELEKARESFQKVLSINSNNLEAMNRMGWIYLDMADYDKAILSFNQVLYRDPNYVSALDGKGFALYKLGLYKEATPYLDQAIILEPESWGALATKGEIAFTKQQPQLASYFLKRAEAINPDAPAVKSLKARLCPTVSPAVNQPVTQQKPDKQND